MQAGIFISVIAYLTTYHSVRPDIIKFTIYVLMLILGLSIYLSHRNFLTSLNRHFNQIFIPILLYCIVVISAQVETLLVVRDINDFSTGMIKAWSYLSADIYYNLIIMISLVLIASVSSILLFKELQKKMLFVLKLAVMNIILWMALALNIMVIYLFENII